MSTNTERCYPPLGVATSTTVKSPINGGASGSVGYSAAVNAAVDVPFVDVKTLAGMGFQSPAGAGSGTTALRPPASNNRLRFYADTTLGAFIWSDGAVWRTVAGALA